LFIAFRSRAHRRQVRRLYRGVYTDDFERSTEVIVEENILAIAAALLPEWQLSHSSAVARGPVDGHLFVSGRGKPGRHLELPGIRVIRLAAPPATEYEGRRSRAFGTSGHDSGQVLETVKRKLAPDIQRLSHRYQVARCSALARRQEPARAGREAEVRPVPQRWSQPSP
jgi:hypothetical protein